MSYFLAVGCSHTEGVGVEPSDVYVEYLSRYLDIRCVNLGKSGSSSEYVLEQIIATLRQKDMPAFIVAQWPNIYRKRFWSNGKMFFENINTAQDIFARLLKQSEDNFKHPWMQHIIIADTVANAKGVPIYHICLEQQDDQPTDQLQEQGITLHLDQKKPGETWFFDNAGSDGLHHSANCHRLWADRLLTIIDAEIANGT